MCVAVIRPGAPAITRPCRGGSGVLLLVFDMVPDSSNRQDFSTLDAAKEYLSELANCNRWRKCALPTEFNGAGETARTRSSPSPSRKRGREYPSAAADRSQPPGFGNVEMNFRATDGSTPPSRSMTSG